MVSDSTTYNLWSFFSVNILGGKNWTPFSLLHGPVPVLKALRAVMTHTTWLQSRSLPPTARCGTHLSPSRLSKWSTFWHASLWSERSRRSSASVRMSWAKLRGLTGLVGTWSPVTDCWLCSIHPDSVNPNDHHLKSKGSIIISFWGVHHNSKDFLFYFQLISWTVLSPDYLFVSHCLCNL